jgi:hypothetical protein
MKYLIWQEEHVGRVPEKTLSVLHKLHRGVHRFDRTSDARYTLITRGSQYSRELTDEGRAFAKKLAAIALDCALDFHTKATKMTGPRFMEFLTVARKLDLVVWTLDTAAEAVASEVESERSLTPNFAIESCQFVISEIIRHFAVDEVDEVGELDEEDVGDEPDEFEEEAVA